MQELTDMTLLERGRQAYQLQNWSAAYEDLTAADREQQLAPQDIFRLALTADLLGKDNEVVALLTRAHNEFVLGGAPEDASRCAFWLATYAALVEGEPARASGWVARGQRLLEDRDCVEQAYIRFPEGLLHMFKGDSATALVTFEKAANIANRFPDPDATTLGRLGRGQALLRCGRKAEGLALLDEVMTAVTAHELSPLVEGLVHCGVLWSCHQIFDFNRAQEWTAAFTRWCEVQPERVQFAGQCHVHRAELLQLEGAWSGAMEEVQRALVRLAQPGSRPWAGSAYYIQGDVYRMRGDFAKAEEAYREASEWGRVPQPGLSLLRLAQGRLEAAAAAIARALVEEREVAVRSKLLAAHVEIMLAAGDLNGAQTSTDELAKVARDLDALLVCAHAAQSAGAVSLAAHDPAKALPLLRDAWTAWHTLEAPYEAARVRVLLAEACRALGDIDGSELELDAARQIFLRLGAMPDLRSLALSKPEPGAANAPGLSEREIEVLRLVSAGKTNRAIAAELFISDHTVRRHLQNIFAKLGVSSRAGATAYAFQHDLV